MTRFLVPFLLLLAFLTAAGSFYSEAQKPKMLTVCDVLSASREYDGKLLSIAGSVLGDRHSVLLDGGNCHGGIFLIHRWGQEGAIWKAFDGALARKRSGLDNRELRIKVIGVFHSSVADGDRLINQFEVLDVLDVRFVNSGTGSSTTKEPQLR